MRETLVLDCSVAAKWILHEPDREPALRLFDRHVSGQVLLIAPDLLLAEFASLLAKRHRRKELSREQAGHAFHLMARSSPKLFHTRPLIPHAMDLALRHQMSLWDCVYIALAIEQNCAFITADQRLFRTGRPRHQVLRLV